MEQLVKYKFRAKTLLSFLLIWALLASAHIFFFTVYARGTYLELGSRLAWREGVYYAPRGRILDKDGKVLAWSERYFDVFLDSEPALPSRRELLYGELKKILGDYSLTWQDNRFLLVKGVAPSKIFDLDKLGNLFPELKIESRVERRCVDYPKVKRFIGNTEFIDGRLVGCEGLELKFDQLLGGTDGMYLVMLDRNRDWVNGTWQLKKEAKPGEDIRLSCSLKDILKNENQGQVL